ncbi:putative membrane protein [Enterobacter hormaechei]|nr:putative membrane protein [Enterobacter hormaechei]
MFLLFSWVAFITLSINILTNEGLWFNFLSTLTMLLMTYVFYCGFVNDVAP